jgi:hypothetical protein
VVPSQGWIIFGGSGIYLTKAMKLESLGANWTEGPDLYLFAPTDGQCTLQVKLESGDIMDRKNYTNKLMA